MVDSKSEGLSNSDDSASKLKLIYDDAENSLKSLKEDVNAFNTRLGVLLGFNATFVRLAMDLPAQPSCFSCLVLKFLTLAFVVGSIALSLIGIYPKGMPIVISPKSQIQKSLGASEKDFREGVIEIRDSMIRDFAQQVGKKAKKFKQALTCLGLAAAMAAVDIAIDLFFCH